MRLSAFLFLIWIFSLSSVAHAQQRDPISGIWTGLATQPGTGTFTAIYAFVSARGGTSEYPTTPCGGVLRGGKRGNVYEYTETITFGTVQERPNDGCVNGRLQIRVQGNEMTWTWTGPTIDGTPLTATGVMVRHADPQ